MSAPTDAGLAERTNELVDACRASSTTRCLRGAQFDAGLALVHLPEGSGGLGGNRGQQAVIDGILRANGVTSTRTCASTPSASAWLLTVLAYGSDELKEKQSPPDLHRRGHLRQLFPSPPTAPTWPASPAGRRDGDEWVVNGQSGLDHLAHLSNPACCSPAPTPTSPSTRAFSYFVLDMHAPASTSGRCTR